MDTNEVIRRAQQALYTQDAEGNADAIEFLDQLRSALGHVEDAKRIIDRINAVVSPS